jgi:hypothetical protein
MGLERLYFLLGDPNNTTLQFKHHDAYIDALKQTEVTYAVLDLLAPDDYDSDSDDDSEGDED